MRSQTLTAFRDRKVAAPLKLFLYTPHLQLRFNLPRPKGRGPIEARPPCAAGRPRASAFRDRKVAAPLKQAGLGLNLWHLHSPSATERSRPH